MRLLPPTRLPRRRLRLAPQLRLAAAGAVMAAGAYLIAVWVVGLVLIVEAVFYVLVVWDDGKPAATGVQAAHEGVLDRWRQAR